METKVLEPENSMDIYYNNKQIMFGQNVRSLWYKKVVRMGDMSEIGQTSAEFHKTVISCTIILLCKLIWYKCNLWAKYP